MRKRIGLLVNPIAGMGGAVGLKGTDGAALPEARRRGGKAGSFDRAVQALRIMSPRQEEFAILTASGEMGEFACREAGMDSEIVHAAPKETSSAEDTRMAAAAMREERVDLILFSGGDGTARDIFAVIGDKVPILGIPAGVRMHSAVFATNPKNAGRLALRALCPDGDPADLREAEIMDAGDEAGSPRLYGYAMTPHLPLLRQAAKAANPQDDDAELEAVCREVAAAAADDRISIVGPGATTRRVKRFWGAEGTLLGVDTFRRGAPVGFDLSESELLRLTTDGRARIIVGVIGGQGYLFGRGNQQLSAEVIRRVGPENILVIASLRKLLALEHGCLLVDTGDEAVDRMLAGHIPVRTGPGRRTIFRVAVP